MSTNPTFPLEPSPGSLPLTPDTLPLGQITALDEVQQRVGISDEKVTEYAGLYREGRDLGRLVVFADGGIFLLADGFHRLRAAALAALTAVPVEVHPGTRRDATLFAASCNLHGKELSNADKRRRVTTLLQDPEWGQWSDNAIAKHCGVAHSFVSRLRDRLSLDSESSDDDEPMPTTRTYRDRYGQVRTMDTSRIGQKAPEKLDESANFTQTPLPAASNGPNVAVYDGIAVPASVADLEHEAEPETLARHGSAEQEHGAGSEEDTESAPAIVTEVESPVPPEERTYDAAVDILATVLGPEVREGILSGDYQLESYDVEALAGMVLAGGGLLEGIKREWPSADPGAYLRAWARSYGSGRARERWLDPEYERHVREKREAQDAQDAARTRRQELDAALPYLEGLARKYGRETVLTEVILSFDHDRAGTSWAYVAWEAIEPLATVLGVAMPVIGTVEECFEALRKVVEAGVQQLKGPGAMPQPEETAMEPSTPAPPAEPEPASTVNGGDVETIAEPDAPPASRIENGHLPLSQAGLSPIERQLAAYLKSIAPEGCMGKQGAEAIGKPYTSTTRAWANLVAKGYARKEERKGGALYYYSEPKETA